jgi:formate C-acetyltransferase
MKVTIDTGVAPYSDAWAGFRGEEWKDAVNVRDFIQRNYTPYEGDEAFLAQATPATTALWQKVMVGIRQENATHAPVDFDTNVATTITAHGPGISTKGWRRSSACKPINRSSVPASVRWDQHDPQLLRSLWP